MNARDSEKLAGILEEIGYKESDTEEADFVIYNTCSVRENANTRVYGRLGHLNAIKKHRKDMLIAICGCMMQEPDEIEKIKTTYKFVDIVFGTHNIFKLAELIYDLKNNPYSRRIMTNIYVHQDLHEMNLYPCAYSVTFNVTKKPGHDKLTLNAILNQRSQDILAANNWNVVQYAALVYMMAQVCDMEAGELVHVIADAHIYDRHIPIIKEMIKRETYPAPKVTLNPEVKDFYEFTTDDFKIEDYQAGEQIKDIPIAI